MPAAVLDTSALSDLIRDHVNVKARISTYSDLIATSVVVVGEIRYGLDRLPLGKKRTGLEARAQAILAALHVEPITEQIAQTYGSLKASFESQGLTLEDDDLWIAATAISNGNLLVTRDQVFSRISGLRAEDWSV